MQVNCLDHPYLNIDSYVEDIYSIYDKDKYPLYKLVFSRMRSPMSEQLRSLVSPTTLSSINNMNYGFTHEREYISVLLDKLNAKNPAYIWIFDHVSDVVQGLFDVYIVVKTMTQYNTNSVELYCHKLLYRVYKIRDDITHLQQGVPCRSLSCKLEPYSLPINKDNIIDTLSRLNDSKWSVIIDNDICHFNIITN